MESFTWCAIGAALGWLAGQFATNPTKVTRIEDILVGIAGSFFGAKFLVDTMWGASPGVSLRGFAMAVSSTVVALILLALMRRAVGPIKVSTSRRRD